MSEAIVMSGVPTEAIIKDARSAGRRAGWRGSKYPFDQVDGAGKAAFIKADYNSLKALRVAASNYCRSRDHSFAVREVNEDTAQGSPSLVKILATLGGVPHFGIFWTDKRVRQPKKHPKVPVQSSLPIG